MRVLCLGAGGIGGYFGGRLVEAGADVTFLVRTARAERLARDGLTIESPLGDAKLTVQAVTQAATSFDVVLLSCKAYDLDTAIESIRPAVGPKTIILPLLNGVAHLDVLDREFGAERTVGGLAHISVALSPDGTIQHFNKLQTLTYGPRTSSQAQACDTLDALFAKAPFDARRSAEVMQDMWEKFVFITAAASITCLMRASLGAILSASDGERLTRQMFDECVSVAAASGYPVRAKARDWGLTFLTQRNSDFKASMLRDIEAGARTEVAQLPGDLVHRGAASAVPTPLLSIALCHLQAYEAQRVA